MFPIEGGPPVAQPRIWARKVFTHMITNHDDDSHCHDYDTMIITDSMVISDIFILVQFKILIQNLNKKKHLPHRRGEWDRLQQHLLPS